MTTQLHFPINQRDTLAQKKANTLLAIDVYSQLHTFVKEAIPSASNDDDDIDTNRQHSAILIDGARGTGKSAVLVNLGLYLADVDKATFDQVHIFKPIDPTLLEDHDNLFLNVIVAAILTDKDVEAAQTKQPEQRTCLHKQLQRLGSALEGLQKQREQQGLDKLRSFIGNHQLIKEVHLFFGAVRKLLGKKLLILAIDDVDTSLNRAFENLEVVRRYLISPYVLPIISGDRSLYYEVTWRDFHGRLLRDSNYAEDKAYDCAQKLANEYQRKILPLQYRLQMPPIANYLKNNNIHLTANDMPPLPLPLFHAWVSALINGQVNGVENSQFILPLQTVRSLAQLISRVKNLIPHLAKAISATELDEMAVKRAILMPTRVEKAVREFEKAYIRGGLTRIASAYSAFNHALSTPDNTQTLPENKISAYNNAWFSKLRDHFWSDPLGGPSCLILQAQADWYPPTNDGNARNIFDTPLFQPLQHKRETFAIFEPRVDLNDWQRQLQGRAPENWLARLPNDTILPYPVPELGKAITGSKKYRFTEGENTSQNNLLIDLVVDKNFYSTNKKANLVCIGRIFELIITSLLRDIHVSDIKTLLQRAPFYSFSAIAGTKTQFITDDNEITEIELPQETNQELAESEKAINLLVGEISTWRRENYIHELNVSPWLVYNVFNKVMNQAWFFNKPMALGSLDFKQNEKTIAWVARKAFNSIWSAFGSFEKGPLYGLEAIISTVNVGDGTKFENSDLFRQNIAPFYSESNDETRFFGKQIRSITFLLGEHPLRKWVEKLPKSTTAPDNNPKGKTSTTTTDGQKTPRKPNEIEKEQAKEKLGKALGVQLGQRVTVATLLNALLKSNLSIEQAKALGDEIRKEFPPIKSTKRIMATFSKAIAQMPAA